jgi:lipopolysaccharide/colanic/teichoic acid biosynthesis glycosyltransferase
VRAPANAAEPAPLWQQQRLIWGMDDSQLHARYWAQFGVQVVRQSEPSQIFKHAELYLLSDPRSLPLFDLRQAMDVMQWVGPSVLFVRVHDTRDRGYREHVLAGDNDDFLGFRRMYDRADRLARVVLTPDREVAELWQKASDPLTGWRRFRRFIPRHERAVVSVEGTVYDRTDDREVALFLQQLVQDWRRPAAIINRVRPIGQGGDAKDVRPRVWADRDAHVSEGAKIIGPVWVGSGRSLGQGDTVVGPTILWDDPDHPVEHEPIQWLHLEPVSFEDEPPAPLKPVDRFGKRMFDLIFAVVALLLTWPFWVIVMAAIWLEDGRPWFFGHKRQTLGGEEFKCWKFRSMRKDAEEIKKRLVLEGVNQADGPQFFMDEDPRLTKVGYFIRKYNLDELPQFINVLTGEMSIVGPRPSPNTENQFAPSWREARLSVRPGITGLWQTRRTRRAGTDFQEWIKYDIEYVEKCSLWLDLKIIWKTIAQIVRKSSRN